MISLTYINVSMQSKHSGIQAPKVVLYWIDNLNNHSIVMHLLFDI